MPNRALLTASLALMASAGVTTAASATTIKLVTGATVSSGAGISGSLKAGTTAKLSGGSAGDITCTTSTFGGSLGTNPNTPSVTGSLTSLTFSGCTDTIPFVTVSTVTTNVSTSNPKPATATYVTATSTVAESGVVATSTVAVSGVVATVTFTDGKTCIYAPTTDPATAQHNSHTSPWNNEYAFAAVPLTKTGGTSFACPSSNVTWSATYVAIEVSANVGITLQPTTASATTMRFLTGTAVAPNFTIAGSTKPGTSFGLSGATGSVTCSSSSLGGTLGSNPASPSVTGSLTSLTSSGCSDTFPFVTMSTVTTNVGAGNAKTLRATYAGTASTLAISGLVWMFTFTDGKTCVYRPATEPATAQHNSHTSPWNAEYAFNVLLIPTGGTSSACSPYMTWTATYIIGSGGTGITIQP